MTLFRVLVAVALFSSCVPAQDGPSHVVVTQRAFPGKRQALLAHVKSVAPRFVHWRDEGAIAGFQLLAGSFTDEEGWDSLAIVQLGPRGLEQWKRFDLELPTDLASTVSAPVDAIEQAAVEGSSPGDGISLVIPFDYQDSLRGAIGPAMTALMKEGILIGYQLFAAHYPAGRSWTGLLVMRYRDWPALSVRRSLPSLPREKVAVIADSVAAR
jgi:hypothetical protein